MLVVEIILIVSLVVAVIAYRLTRLSAQKLILIVIGALFGSLIGSLLAAPLSALSEPYRQYLPIAVTIVLAISMAAVFFTKHDFLDGLMNKKTKTDKVKQVKLDKGERRVLVDTSAIIDGRIGDIVSTGFIPGVLIVPRFVLAELQNIADSEDPLRRGRGRRGLEILNEMRLNDSLQLDIIEENPESIKEVDHKLVYLAKKYRANILTTDYNLNRVATIEGVKILNINELANSIRAVVLPGEIMKVQVVQAGKEKNQGVGYLPDGTMIVVDKGDKMIGKEVDCEVTRIFQTVAGKMIFAAPISHIKQSANKINHKTEKNNSNRAKRSR